MKRLTWITLAFCLCFASWTASWADWEELMATLTSDAPEGFGHAVDNAGDVNGDGFQDLVVSGSESLDLKLAYIYFGGPSFDTIPDIKLASDNASFGDVLSAAGDVNKDGYSDIMFLSHLGEIEIVCVYFGGSPMDTVVDVVLTGRPDQREFFGQTMSEAGDLNGDGYDDVLIGAYLAPNGGKAYVFFGGNPMDSIPDLILKSKGGWSFGLGVGDLGDVNRDGYADIGVGDPHKSSCTGKVYIYFGGREMDRIPDVVISGERAFSNFGYYLKGGDLNGDGYSDIVVGAITLGNGKVYLYRGGPSIGTRPDLSMTGRLITEELGQHVKVVGDLDQDGYNDLVSRTNTWCGNVYAFYGGKMMDRDIDLVVGACSYFGHTFDGIDINGDGHQDLAVGSPMENKTYLYRIRYNQFVIELTPDTLKVVKGDKLGFQAAISNNTKVKQNLHFWGELLDPEGNPYGGGPVIGPKLKKIPANKTVVRHITMEIPGDPILGEYTFTLKADTVEPKSPYLDFIENDSFEFELISGEKRFGHRFINKEMYNR